MRRTLLVTAVLVMLPAIAWAEDTCQDDADCPDGQYCMMMATGACPPCEPGEECPCEYAEPEGYCTENYEDDYDGSLITNTECSSDADCPSGFACKESMMPCMDVPTCACADCAEGEECEPCDCGEPEPCEATATMLCVYEPKACETDSDCGENFECYADQICSGGGSAGCACAAPACECDPCDGADCQPCECAEPEPCDCDTEPVDFEETCETVGAWCAPAEIACTQNSECPADWECYTYTMGSDCACGGGACPEGAECEPVECECPDEPETTTEGFCVPGGWTEVIDSVSAGEYGAPQADGEATGGGSGGAGGGEGPAKGGLGGLLGGNADNVSGGTDNGGGGGNGGGTGSGDDGAGSGGVAAGSGSSGSGCSTATDAATGMAAIFAILLGIFAVLTRRVAGRED
jgi:hypothetical protein